jgi:cytoskeletal protein CcmA (bactofilin family)
VGEKGEVEAAVQAGVAIIGGQIRGNITARERVELRGTARIYGNIVTPVLVLEEGVVIDGQCKTNREEASDPHGHK